MDLKLKGKTALVTGGSEGIALALAKEAGRWLAHEPTGG
jgi:NAD(P)-dependent dehydrogenase (short-subunit alcohol dehydrogenase family)